MIPKVIHYCWFGPGEYSPEIRMCLESWKKFCPGWEIKLWNENNSPMDIPWVRDAYKHQKYAFVADYVRFWALYHEGGVYLDTDMLLVKPLDAFLEHSVFLGREDAYNASMGIIGSVKESGFCHMCLAFYDSTVFNLASIPIITRLITPQLFRYGFMEEDTTQHLSNGVVVYKSECFYPIHYSTQFELSEIGSFIKPDTYGVHLWNRSWKDEIQMLASGEYREGFRLVWKRILRTPILPLKYYKKVVKYLFYWISGK